MKKIISLIISIIITSSICSPVFAIERDPNTNELCETFDCKSNNFIYETITNFSTAEANGEVFHLNAKAAYNVSVGMAAGSDHNVTITANDGVDVTITRIEARVTGDGSLWQYVGISGGTKDQNYSQKYGSWVSVSDINSNKFEFVGGASFYTNCIKVYYICNSHNWNENGNCKSCDAQICETNGEHTWDDNGHCKYCNKFLCDETGEHAWKDNGHCEYCDKLKCDVTGEHEHTSDVKIPAYIVKHNCDYCGETVSEEVVAVDNNTASVFGSGNKTIIYCIACILLGIGCGYYICNNKKK